VAAFMGGVVLAGVSPSALAQDLESAVDALWAAGSGDEIDAAVETILGLNPDIEPLWVHLRNGATYDADAPRGRRVLSRENADGVEHRYLLYVPEDYDSARRYPVRVYLHGGVSRPRRAEGEWWRNNERYARSDSLVVFPESWADSVWWESTQIENLTGMLNDVKRRYNVDENAVYLLGISDGATGAYFHAFKAPTPWAAFLPFNGHPVVLANPSMDVEGQMYVTNLRNKPFFVINGGQDRLYPVESVLPFLQLFADAGVNINFRPQPEAGHDMRWWADESPNIDEFIETQARRPLPDRVVWETESTDRFNRAHWVVITALGSVDGETSFDNFDTLTPQAPSAPIGFNMLGELDTGAGIQLIDIVPGSLAEAAGVQAGDILVEVNGIAVATVDEGMSRPLLKLGGGFGDILRDLLLHRITEAKALVSGAEGRDELRHVRMPLQTPKALGRFEDAGGDPAQHHLAAPPARDVTLHLTGPADKALDGVGRSERALKPGREVQRQDGHRLLEPFPHTGCCAGMLPVEAAREVPQQPRRGCDIRALIRPPEDRLHPGLLPLWQVVEDVAGLVDLATLHERGAVEHRGDGRP